MPTLKATLSVPHREEAERLSAILEAAFELEAVPISLFENEDNGLWTVEVFRQGSDPAHLRKDLEQALGGDAFSAALDVDVLGDRDWVSASLEGLPAVRAGGFLVHGRHARNELRSTDTGLLIEAGQAFGTGHHGTTLGCLEAINWLASRARVSKALDVGTGTGVLAIALAKAARTKVIASDVDPIAVAVAGENASANHVHPLVRSVLADGVPIQRASRSPYDLVMANILARPLLAMAQTISRSTKPRGWVLLSGLMQHQQRTILARYRSEGLIPTHRFYHGEWVSLVLRKR